MYITRHPVGHSLKEATMQYEAITEKRCAYRVYDETGFGLLESVFEKCMGIELRMRGSPQVASSRSPYATAAKSWEMDHVDPVILSNAHP
jgi:hypothetical protein